LAAGEGGLKVMTREAWARGISVAVVVLGETYRTNALLAGGEEQLAGF
jgi:hypothetical protein